MEAKKLIIKTFASFLAIIILMQCDSKRTFNGYFMQEGDLLFQEGDCGSFCEAIKKVTVSVDNLNFSHIGIVKKSPNGDWRVIEAVSDGVVETPLEVFLQRNVDGEGNPKVAVGRLKENYVNLIPDALKNSENYMGKPYDYIFNIENDAYYCSELIYHIFKEANQGAEIFLLEPMTFKDPETGKTFPVWKKYYEELGVPIPENEPGLNPGNISRSEKLIIFYPYSQFNLIRSRAS